MDKPIEFLQGLPVQYQIPINTLEISAGAMNDFSGWNGGIPLDQAEQQIRTRMHEVKPVGGWTDQRKEDFSVKFGDEVGGLQFVVKGRNTKNGQIYYVSEVRNPNALSMRDVQAVRGSRSR